MSQSLDNINRKYNVRKIRPIIKNFKSQRQRMKNLVKKDKATLTKKEKHLLRRLKRAPKGAKVPERRESGSETGRIVWKHHLRIG